MTPPFWSDALNFGGIATRFFINQILVFPNEHKNDNRRIKTSTLDLAAGSVLE